MTGWVKIEGHYIPYHPDCFLERISRPKEPPELARYTSWLDQAPDLTAWTRFRIWLTRP